MPRVDDFAAEIAVAVVLRARRRRRRVLAGAEWLTLRQAATLCELTPPDLARLLLDGLCPVRLFESRYGARLRRADVVAWQAERAAITQSVATPEAHANGADVQP